MEPSKSYLKKRKSALKFMIRTPRRKFGQNRFHLLRVEIKKLKATLYRIEFLLPDFDRKKFYKPFRKLFAQAGRVREIQIEKEILKDFAQQEEIPEYLKYLDKTISEERSRFFQLRSLGLNIKIEKRLKTLTKKSQETEKLDPTPFLTSLINEIKLLLNTGKLKPKNAHELRKKLKNLKYNLESLKWGKVTIQHLDQGGLVNQLGTWHDLVIVHQSIKTRLPDTPIKKEEKDKLRKINRKIKAKSDTIFEEINQKNLIFDDFILHPKPRLLSV